MLAKEPICSPEKCTVISMKHMRPPSHMRVDTANKRLTSLTLFCLLMFVANYCHTWKISLDLGNL